MLGGGGRGRVRAGARGGGYEATSDEAGFGFPRKDLKFNGYNSCTVVVVVIGGGMAGYVLVVVV